MSNIKICEQCGATITGTSYGLNSRKYKDKIFCTQDCADKFAKSEGAIFKALQRYFGI